MRHAYPEGDVFYRRPDRPWALGLIVWPNTGHVDGESGDLIMLAPPFTIDEDEIRKIAARLAAALGDVE